ncbi:hypothetical protein I7I50_11143 [Histoplasma capsulatum G186AR]|nr:hypothetical protein I7I52_02382 [Histoplasma capsulatum]QSS69743.1 hypothetical protein I7I50_11143 [Histoplasma capsulatum G186AR]
MQPGIGSVGEPAVLWIPETLETLETTETTEMTETPWETVGSRSQIHGGYLRSSFLRFSNDNESRVRRVSLG